MAATSLPPVLLTPPKPTYSPALDPEETHRGRRRHRLTDGDDNANTPTRSSNNPLRLFLARTTSHHGHHRPGSTESSTLRGRPRHRSSSPFWSRTTPALQRTPLECGSPVSVETSLTAAGGAVPVPVPASAIILLRAALAAAGVGAETRSVREEASGMRSNKWRGGRERRRRRRSLSPSRSRSPATRRAEVAERVAGGGGGIEAESGDAGLGGGSGVEAAKPRVAGLMRRVDYEADNDDYCYQHYRNDDECGWDTKGSGRRRRRRRQRTRSRGGEHHLC